MHKREAWRALRRFRTPLQVVGQTRAGRPVFQVGPATLVRLPGVPHFTRVVACARCGELMETQEPVVRRRDLRAEGVPHVCETCADLPTRASGRTRPPTAPAPAPTAGPGARAPADGKPRVRSGDRQPIAVPTAAEQAVTALLAEAEARAAEVVGAAEREAAGLRADAGRLRKEAATERERAVAARAEAEARAAQLVAAAEAETARLLDGARAERDQAMAAATTAAEAWCAEIVAAGSAEAQAMREEAAADRRQAAAAVAEAKARAAGILPAVRDRADATELATPRADVADFLEPAPRVRQDAEAGLEPASAVQRKEGEVPERTVGVRQPSN